MHNFPLNDQELTEMIRGFGGQSIFLSCDFVMILIFEMNCFWIVLNLIVHLYIDNKGILFYSNTAAWKIKHAAG